jgi:hypothetical protein
MNLFKLAKESSLKFSTNRMTQKLFTRKEMILTESLKSIITHKSLFLKVLQLAKALLLGDEESLPRLKMPSAANSKSQDNRLLRSTFDLNTSEGAKDPLHTIFTMKLGLLPSCKVNTAHQDLCMFHKGDSNMMLHPKEGNSSKKHNNITKGNHSKGSKVRENSMQDKNLSNSFNSNHFLCKNSRITNITANTCVQKVLSLGSISLSSNQNITSTTEVNKYSNRIMEKTMVKKKVPMIEDLM